MSAAKVRRAHVAPSVLVTGASGFLGKHLTAALCAEDAGAPASAGAGIRAVVRHPSLQLDRLGVQTLLGDVGQATVCARAVEGVETIYHLAGMVSRRDDDSGEMYRIHVDGTRTLLHAAAAAGVRRVVILSTSGTLAVSHDPEEVGTEDNPPRREIVARWPYYLSKIFQEETALEISHATGLDIVVLNPSLLLGPGDERASSTGDVEKVVRGRLPIIPRGGGVSFVDVRDVAQACIAAMQRGRTRERYLLGAANMSLESFLGRVARLAGRPAPRPWASTESLLRLGKLLDGVGSLWGASSALDRQSLEMAQCGWYVDSSKATRELGFSPRDPQATLYDTVRDIEQRHNLRPRTRDDAVAPSP